jgi:hypothetical protein
MNLDKKPAQNLALFSLPPLESLTADVPIPAELEEIRERYNEQYSDQYSYRMDKAIGLQKSSIEAAARMQSELIDTYKHAAWCTPQFADWLDSVAKALATCMEWQLGMLSLFVPLSPSTALPEGKPVNAEELEHGMDLGTGQRKRSATRHKRSAS